MPDAPVLEQRDSQWQEVMQLSEKYGLIEFAYGGIAVLMHQDEQERQGVRDRVQYQCGLSDIHPKSKEL